MTGAGICSVTYRGSEPEAVAAAAASAGLSCVEWAGDVHAPVDRPELVRRCRDASAASGLRIASLGSYWRAGVSTLDDGVRQLAVAGGLGAPRVRVWAGAEASCRSGADARAAVVRSLQSLADRAADLGIEIAVEHHPNTLSDTAEMTLRLLEEIDREGVTTYWQPDLGQPADVALGELEVILARAGDRLSAVHVFSWWPRDERHRLAHRADLWAPALHQVGRAAPQADVMIEFVPGDALELLAPEAQTMRAWMRA